MNLLLDMHRLLDKKRISMQKLVFSNYFLIVNIASYWSERVSRLVSSLAHISINLQM